MKDKKIYCPCCNSELVVTHRDRYEDLVDHVSNPNGTPSMKDGYQCIVESCSAHKLNATWLQDGELFMNPPDGISWSQAHNTLESLSSNGTGYALNSFTHYMEEGRAKVKKFTKSIKIFKYKITFYPAELGWKYPMNKQFLPNFFHWKVEYWRESRDGLGYTSIYPDYRMIKHCIRKFKTSYNSVLYNPVENRNSLKDCIDLIKAEQYGHPDDRRYVKITSWILNIFYKERVSNIKIIAYAQGLTKIAW